MTQLPSSTPNPSSSFDLNRPTIIALLYLASFLTGITSLIGLVLAYVWKSESGEDWTQSHYSFHIRTFWYGFLGSIICTILMLVLIGFLGFIALAVWVAVRTILAMLKAQRRESIPNPKTWLW